MFSRLSMNRDYTLDEMMKRLGDPVPITYSDHVVIIDREDGLYYILKVTKKFLAPVYPVYYKILKSGKWNTAIQSLIMFDKDA